MKYYDLISTTIVGIVVVVLINFQFYGGVEVDGFVYIALGYFVGYFINAIGSILEWLYYKIVGAPSDNFLVLKKNKKWTGCCRVKFYEAEKTIELLKKELADDNASTQKMFNYAMRKVNGSEDSRIAIFNAQYAGARTMFITILLLVISYSFCYYDEWLFWLIAVLLLFISFNRFKERGYYYAREVLNEYLTQTTKNDSL